jgi:hypothetical protein
MKKKKERVTKEKLLAVREQCRLDHEALLALLESGELIPRHKLCIVLGLYREYLCMMKEYAIVQRRELRKEHALCVYRL